MVPFDDVIMVDPDYHVIQDQGRETFSALLALCAGKLSVTGEFPTQRPMMQSCDVFFDLRPNKRLRRDRAHYDVNVMNHWCPNKMVDFHKTR